MALISKGFRVAFPLAALAAAALAPASARADFFDDARKTFTTDIPHFFQDDVPCAFGGKPTSGTKASCNQASQPVKPAPKVEPAPPPPPPPSPPPSTDQ
ncbi:MAG TPA: hypothetical protein VMU85_23155 [Stellaceae bacterium]|nr:hypothetical protein [Stellaceae bacterium]